MGESVSKLIRYTQSESCADFERPLFSVDTSISSLIFDLVQEDIKSHLNTDDFECFPYDLIKECLEYVGCFIDSQIFCHRETSTLDALLLHHHKIQSITSPVTRHGYVKYYDLLYRSSVNGENGEYSNTSFLKALRANDCVNIGHFVILYQTNYNHVFAVYLHNPIQTYNETEYKRETNKDRDIGFVDDIFYMNTDHFFWNGHSFISLCLLRFVNNTNKHVHGFYPKNLDLMGNELVGGNTFDPQPRIHYYFDLKQVELYRIL
eukprot:464743_1